MSSLRVWIAILALISFGAGLACGPLLARGLLPASAPPAPGPFPDYERLLVSSFELGPERVGLLRVVLAGYEEELARIKDRHMADYMSAMEPELSERGRYYRGLIRDKVLPENQRERFDRLSQGLPPNLSTH